MYVCIWMQVYVYVCICICINACVSMCMCILCMHVYMYMCVFNIYILCMCVHVYVYLHGRLLCQMGVCVCLRIPSWCWTGRKMTTINFSMIIPCRSRVLTRDWRAPANKHTIVSYQTNSQPQEGTTQAIIDTVLQEMSRLREEVVKALHWAKNGKAICFDEIPIECLKNILLFHTCTDSLF